jgi:hypothetical protein
VNESASVADAIARKLTDRGLVPTGGVFAEVHYVAVAKVTVFDVEGNLDESYQYFDNLDGNDEQGVLLAHRMVGEAERRAGWR